jgi:O-methyltransferase involved in polyketide biosynthesis
MKKIEVDAISGVPETMLIPLWAKAVETGKDGAIIRDAKSVEIVNASIMTSRNLKSRGRARPACQSEH